MYRLLRSRRLEHSDTLETSGKFVWTMFHSASMTFPLLAVFVSLFSSSVVGRQRPGHPDRKRGEGARERRGGRQERIHARGMHPHRRRPRNHQRNRGRAPVGGEA